MVSSTFSREKEVSDTHKTATGALFVEPLPPLSPNNDNGTGASLARSIYRVLALPSGNAVLGFIHKNKLSNT